MKVVCTRIERFFELEIYIFATSFRWIHEESVRWIEAFVLFIIGKIFERDECEKSKFHCTNYSKKLFVLLDRYSIDVAEKLFSSLPFAIFIIYSTGLKRLSRELKWSGDWSLNPSIQRPARTLKSKLESFKYTDSRDGLFTFLANNRRI